MRDEREVMYLFVEPVGSEPQEREVPTAVRCRTHETIGRKLTIKDTWHPFLLVLRGTKQLVIPQTSGYSILVYCILLVSLYKPELVSA